MKKFLLPILLLHLAMVVNATTYYFSSSSGDDSRTADQAKNSATPWRTINKLNSVMYMLQPGDKILFKRGETFSGTINITVSGSASKRIVFNAYGNGDRPVINGFATVTGWSQVRSNVWEADFNPASNSTNMVIMNDRQQRVGRWPNADEASGGYLNINSHSGMNQISSNQLTSGTNWTGGEVVIRKVRWVTDRGTITSQYGNTLTFTPNSGYEPSNNYGFFIQSHTNTLDRNGEWYYDKNRKKLQMYFSSNNPNSYTIKGSVTGTLVSAKYQSYITFANLAFNGSNENAFDLFNANYITIKACTFNYSGGNAINASTCNTLNIINNSIANSNNNGVFLYFNCPNALIKNNTVSNTGVYAGMGQNESDSYQAIVMRGDNSMVQYNKVDTTGYNGIHFHGDYITVQNNFVNYFNFIKDDGAGIYTHVGTGDNTVMHNGGILNNIILNGIGAAIGSSDSLVLQSAGIYLDDNSNHLTISGNTISACSMVGINNHNGHELTITNNTMFDNKIQFQQVRDYISPNPIRNCNVNGNIMFSKLASQLANNASSVENDIAQFGSYDKNHYCRPIDDNYVFSYSYYQSGQYVQSTENLAGWQSKFGFDKSSQKSPVDIPSSIIKSTSGVNKYQNPYYDVNVNDVSPYSPLNDIKISWNANKLDAGTLQVSSNTYSGSNTYVLSMPVGALTKGKTYMLSFSVVGATNDRSLDVFLRKIGAPYTEFSPRTKISLTSNRADYQYGIVSNGDDNASCILMNYDKVNGPLWIDNVHLEEANVQMTNPDDYIIFKYNQAKGAKSFKVKGTYYDVYGNKYTDKVTLQPFTSIILIKETENNNYAKTTDAAPQSISVKGNLVNANASLMSTPTADVNWSVDNQVADAQSYEVERSADATTFASIGNTSVKAAAGKTTASSYNFTDRKPLSGKNFYRIKQLGKNGKYVYSKVVVVNNISFRLNPNPAHDILHVLFDNPVTSADHLNREVTVQNTSGTFKKVFPMNVSDKMTRADLNVSTLPNGIYMLSIVSDGQTISRAFLKQ